MTKADIVEQIYEQVGFSKKESAELVEKVFEAIKETLADGEKVKISGFGNFVVRDKNSRKGRNPQTGQEILLDARKVLTFKPSLVLKNMLNDPPVTAGRGRSRRGRSRTARRERLRSEATMEARDADAARRARRRGRDSGAALLPDRRGEPDHGREGLRAALLGVRVPLDGAAEVAVEAAPVPPARHRDDPADQEAALRAALHDRGCAQEAARDGRRHRARDAAASASRPTTARATARSATSWPRSAPSSERGACRRERPALGESRARRCSRGSLRRRSAGGRRARGELRPVAGRARRRCRRSATPIPCAPSGRRCASKELAQSAQAPREGRSRCARARCGAGCSASIPPTTRRSRA